MSRTTRKPPSPFSTLFVAIGFFVFYLVFNTLQ